MCMYMWVYICVCDSVSACVCMCTYMCVGMFVFEYVHICESVVCVCTLAQCLHTCVGHESRKGTLKWKDEILGEVKRIKRGNELHRPWRRKVGLIQERKEERWGRRDRGSLKVSKWLVPKIRTKYGSVCTYKNVIVKPTTLYVNLKECKNKNNITIGEMQTGSTKQ